MTDDLMVVVDGVRYRKEDAPKTPKATPDTQDDADVAGKERSRPANKSRTTATKG